MVLPHKPEEREEAHGHTPTDERVEVIKVCELVPTSVWSCVECVSSSVAPPGFSRRSPADRREHQDDNGRGVADSGGQSD